MLRTVPLFPGRDVLDPELRGKINKSYSGFEQFGSLRFKDFKRLDEAGERVPVDNGKLDWGGYEATFIRVRDFHRVHEEPTFTDTVRVNLTLGSRCCVLYLRWPRMLPGNSAGAEAFLAALQPPS